MAGDIFSASGADDFFGKAFRASARSRLEAFWGGLGVARWIVATPCGYNFLPLPLSDCKVSNWSLSHDQTRKIIIFDKNIVGIIFFNFDFLLRYLRYNCSILDSLKCLNRSSIFEKYFAFLKMNFFQNKATLK